MHQRALRVALLTTTVAVSASLAQSLERVSGASNRVAGGAGDTAEAPANGELATDRLGWRVDGAGRGTE